MQVIKHYGFDVNVDPCVDRFVKPDGWDFGERLIAGDDFSSFRLPTGSNGPIKSLAVEIEITGRTIQKRMNLNMVRVRIRFVGDGEPDQVTRGYMETPLF